MKENRQSPEIRMEGFEDDWIYNNLRKLAIFNPKQNRLKSSSMWIWNL